MTGVIRILASRNKKTINHWKREICKSPRTSGDVRSMYKVRLLLGRNTLDAALDTFVGDIFILLRTGIIDLSFK
jgi:hypothetical protein